MERHAASDESARSGEAFDGRLPPPRYASLETTRYCNLECPMCIPFNLGTTRSGPHMTFDVFERYAEELFPVLTWWQPSVTGEPLMSRDFGRMLDLADRYGVRLDLVTNGTLMSEAMIGKLVPQLANLSVSCGGATRETFESIRQGASFERVLDNLRSLVARVRQMPEAERPRLGLNTTLMESNVRELPGLVELALSLGLDFVETHHVYPVTAADRAQSLVHHSELARRWIDRALGVAARSGFPLSIAALDEIIESAPGQVSAEREVAKIGAGIAGLGRREVCMEQLRPVPGLSRSRADHDAVRQRRQESASRYWYPAKRESDRTGEAEAPIQVCDFLWDRALVDIQGGVRPCCVVGAPLMGLVHPGQGFNEIWNGRVYRSMRQRLVAGDPAPVCRGCGYIRTITDPSEAGRWLQGGRVPRPEELDELPPVLRAEDLGKDPDLDLLRLAQPAHKRVSVAAPAPLITWPSVAGARYRIEILREGSSDVIWSTGKEEHVPGAWYQLPEAAWRQAPEGVLFRWRVLRIDVADHPLVAQGVIEKLATV